MFLFGSFMLSLKVPTRNNFSRVDCYKIGEHPLFGAITFTPGRVSTASTPRRRSGNGSALVDRHGVASGLTE